MTKNPKICIVGDIVVDVTLKTQKTDLKLRLGGIIHAARTLWALNIPYSIAYFAPAYLDEDIKSYLQAHGCDSEIKLGNVVGAPFVFLINEAKEIGDQGYEFLLRERIKVEYDTNTCNIFFKQKFDDYLLISGNYDLPKIVNQLKGKLHTDATNNIKDFSFLNSISQRFESLFVSTSSTIFQDFYKDDFNAFVKLFAKYTKKIIIKENRGGSRGYDFVSSSLVEVASQTGPIIHSVGVGDSYCATFVGNYTDKTLLEAMTLSAWVAKEYAITTYPDDFKNAVNNILRSDIKDLVSMGGTILPWEKRRNIQIYIAAPDFDFVDTSLVDKVAESLTYHNFSPRRPVKEHGQMQKNADKARRQELFSKDIELLNNCSILIAVLLYNDPGTLIEIGMASSKGIPTIVYDPFNTATNCMLTETPALISSDLDEIISEVFIIGSKIVK